MPTMRLSNIKSEISHAVEKVEQSLKATRREIKQWTFDHKVSFKSARVKAEVAPPRMMGDSEKGLMKRARQCVAMIVRSPRRDQICAHQQMVCAELLTLAEEAARDAEKQGMKSSEPLIAQAFADAVADLDFDQLQSIRLKALEFNAIAGKVLQGSVNPVEQTIRTRKLLLNHMMNACNVRLFTKGYDVLKHKLSKTKAVTEEAAVEGLIDWLVKPSKDLVTALRGNTRLDDILPLVRQLAVGANVYGEGRLLRCLFDEFWGDDKIAIDLIEGLGRRAVVLDKLTKGRQEYRDLNGTAWLMRKVYNAYYLSREVHGGLKNGHTIWMPHETQSVPPPKPPTEADKAWAWSLTMGGDKEVTNIVTSFIDGTDVEEMIHPIEKLADKDSIDNKTIGKQLLGLFGRFGYFRGVEDLRDFALTLKSIAREEEPGGLMAHRVAHLAFMVASAHVSAHHEDLPPLEAKEQREESWGQRCRDLLDKYAEAERSEPRESERNIVSPEPELRTNWMRPRGDKGKERETEPSPDETASSGENVEPWNVRDHDPKAYPPPTSEADPISEPGDDDDWRIISGPYRAVPLAMGGPLTAVIDRLFESTEPPDMGAFIETLQSLNEPYEADGDAVLTSIDRALAFQPQERQDRIRQGIVRLYDALDIVVGRFAENDSSYQAPPFYRLANLLRIRLEDWPSVPDDKLIDAARQLLQPPDEVQRRRQQILRIAEEANDTSRMRAEPRHLRRRFQRVPANPVTGQTSVKPIAPPESANGKADLTTSEIEEAYAELLRATGENARANSPDTERLQEMNELLATLTANASPAGPEQPPSVPPLPLQSVISEPGPLTPRDSAISTQPWNATSSPAPSEGRPESLRRILGQQRGNRVKLVQSRGGAEPSRSARISPRVSVPTPAQESTPVSDSDVILAAKALFTAFNENDFGKFLSALKILAEAENADRAAVVREVLKDMNMEIQIRAFRKFDGLMRELRSWILDSRFDDDVTWTLFSAWEELKRTLRTRGLDRKPIDPGSFELKQAKESLNKLYPNLAVLTTGA